MTAKPGFTVINLPNHKVAFVPETVRVQPHPAPAIADDKLHVLMHIPWDDKYLAHIPARYLEFFKYVLPHLGARTTDVHTALSVSHLAELISLTNQPVDVDVLYIAVILHDSGWAQLDPDEIADSLGYSSVAAYSSQALRPKEMHSTLGAQMAKQLLRNYTGKPQLSDIQQRYVRDLVYYHDLVRPWPKKPEPIEYLLLGDADRLWSYTHENFWLDTIRKNTGPATYVKNLKSELEGFFLADPGRTIARRLITDREGEVGRYLAT